MRVAVIIPCHNVEQHVRDAVLSALAQTHGDLDVVCVDDGSSDGTRAVLEALASAHAGRIRVVHQTNQGASAARNAGLRATEGAYVQFLDADDVLAPDKIERQLELAQASGGAQLVVGDFEQVMPNGLLLPALAIKERPWMALIKTRMGTTSANLWERKALEQVGGWNEDLASSQDYELMFRLLRAGARVAWDPVVRTQVLKRASGSISRTDVMANWDRYIALRRSMKEHLERSAPKEHAAEIEALRQYIFMALRIVAAQDLPKALAEYRRSVGGGFRPQVGRAITERYALLHNLLGFGGAERVLRALKRNRTPAT